MDSPVEGPPSEGKSYKELMRLTYKDDDTSKQPGPDLYQMLPDLEPELAPNSGRNSPSLGAPFSPNVQKDSHSRAKAPSKTPIPLGELGRSLKLPSSDTLPVQSSDETNNATYETDDNSSSSSRTSSPPPMSPKLHKILTGPVYSPAAPPTDSTIPFSSGDLFTNAELLIESPSALDKSPSKPMLESDEEVVVDLESLLEQSERLGADEQCDEEPDKAQGEDRMTVDRERVLSNRNDGFNEPSENEISERDEESALDIKKVPSLCRMVDSIAEGNIAADKHDGGASEGVNLTNSKGRYNDADSKDVESERSKVTKLDTEKEELPSNAMKKAGEANAKASKDAKDEDESVILDDNISESYQAEEEYSINESLKDTETGAEEVHLWIKWLENASKATIEEGKSHVQHDWQSFWNDSNNSLGKNGAKSKTNDAGESRVENRREEEAPDVAGEGVSLKETNEMDSGDQNGGFEMQAPSTWGAFLKMARHYIPKPVSSSSASSSRDEKDDDYDDNDDDEPFNWLELSAELLYR